MSTTSDTSPPLKNFSPASGVGGMVDESSPENNNTVTSRLRNGQSTESLDSLSDESGSHHHRHRQRHQQQQGQGHVSASRNPVPPPRKVTNY